MSFIDQLNRLRRLRDTPVARLAELVGMARPNLVTTLTGKHDSRGSTLDALASALEAQWVLVPKEHLLEVQRILEGRGTGPDYEAKSAVELFLEKSK